MLTLTFDFDAVSMHGVLSRDQHTPCPEAFTLSDAPTQMNLDSMPLASVRADAFRFSFWLRSSQLNSA